MSVTQSLRDENAQLSKEGQILREEAIILKAELEVGAVEDGRKLDARVFRGLLPEPLAAT